MEEVNQSNEMPQDLDEYIIKGMTEYRWSFDYMVKDLQKFGIEEQEACSIVTKVVKENHINQSVWIDSMIGSDDSSLSKDLSNGASIAIGVALFAGLVFALAKTSFVELAMFLIIMLLVGSAILYYCLTIPTDKRIIRKLNKMGFKCFLDEGRIIFKRNDYNWRISTFEIKKRYRRTAFSLSITTDILDGDHALTNRIFCIVASRHPNTVIIWDGKNSYHCLFETVLTSTRDIEREFTTAMQKMDDTLDELYEIFRQAFANRPPEEEHKVGFRMGSKDSSSEDAPYEIRAQKETETTN